MGEKVLQQKKRKRGPARTVIYSLSTAIELGEVVYKLKGKGWPNVIFRLGKLIPQFIR